MLPLKATNDEQRPAVTKATNMTSLSVKSRKFSSLLDGRESR